MTKNSKKHQRRYDHNDNKRRKYHDQSHPSFWSNPPKEDIEEAFSRGWVALPNDKILEFDRTKNADEAGLRSLKTVKRMYKYLEILADLCCSANAIMMRGGQRGVYGNNPNKEVCTKFIFGSKEQEMLEGKPTAPACNVCTHDFHKGSCVSQHKDIKKLTKWYKEKKDPCWTLCDKLTPRWGDIIGQRWCTDRCRAAIGVNAVWLNDDQNIKVKMRVWIQPDERMYSSISPSEDITSGREYATRCDVCGTLVFEHVEFENITLSQCVMFLVYMSPQITRTSLEFYHSKINTRVQTLR